MKKFLISKGFTLIRQESSEYFGNNFKTYSNGHFNVRLVSSKSIASIEIGRALDINQWYDLALVRALLYNEKRLNKVTTIEEYSDFLQKELASITEYFSNANFPDTKRRLEELENERVKQMFPRTALKNRRRL